MEKEVRNTDRLQLSAWPTFWSSHEPVRRYLKSLDIAYGGVFSPAVELSAIDAFLMGQVIGFYASAPVVIDMASEATMGASMIFWLSQPNIRCVVSRRLSDSESQSGWQTCLRSTLREIDPAATVCWVDTPHDNRWSETVKRDTAGPLVFSFSAGQSELSGITKQLESLFELSRDTVVFIFPLGQIGENGLLKAALEFCFEDPAQRLIALREVSPFFASSQVGLLYRSNNTQIPEVLERIRQLYDGNFQFIRLVKDSVDTAVAKNLSIKTTAHSRKAFDSAVSAIKKRIPNPIKNYIKLKLLS